jgi:endonuclease/exonuclease/phosphatase family metal-dependent hydrolase
MGMRRDRFGRILIMKARFFQASWIAVFFLQALRVIFSTMFGVIYDQIFEGPMSLWLPVSNFLVILALLAPALLARRVRQRRLTLLAITASLSRILLSIDDANIRYWGALVILATAGSYLWMKLRESNSEFALVLVWGILWEYVLRILGDTFDLSLQDGSLPFVAVGALALVVISVWISRASHDDGVEDKGIPWSLSLGVGSFLFLEMTLFALPSAVARYSSLAYPLMAILLFVASAIVLLPGGRRMLDSLFALRRVRALLMLLALLGFICGYFQDGWKAAGGLIISQAIIMASLVYTLESARSVDRKTHWRFPLGLIWMLVLNFLSAFAFTYPYTLPMMRERGWLVHLVALLILGWGVIRPATREQRARVETSRLPGTLVAFAALLIVFFVWPRAPEPLPQENLRLATWNIHYGYDDDWHTNLQEMAEVIASEGVDVIAMQEVDTGRMTSYSSDNAYFLARRLGMQVVYLPAVEHLTGIALLYKGPPVPSDVAFLTSVQEQTGIVHAALDWGSSGLDAYGIWMGLSDEDTLRQIDEALAYIGPASPASFGGDFNSRPEDPEIDAVRAAAFADPFDLLGVENPAPTSPAIDPQGRIDFVWLRGLIPQRAWVSESLASDHRMVVVEVVQP